MQVDHGSPNTVMPAKAGRLKAHALLFCIRKSLQTGFRIMGCFSPYTGVALAYQEGFFEGIVIPEKLSFRSQYGAKESLIRNPVWFKKKTGFRIHFSFVASVFALRASPDKRAEKKNAPE